MSGTWATRRPRAYASAIVVLLLLAHARVTILPGLTVPALALMVAAGLVLLAAVTWLAVRTLREFRSPPGWYPARAAAWRCPACRVRPQGGIS